MILREEKGVTLVEILAAITILAVLIIPISQILSHAYTAYSNDLKKDKAVMIAQKYIEEAKLNQTWLNNYSTYPIVDGYYLVPFSGTDQPYVGRILMKQSTIHAQLIQIKVEIYFEDVIPSQLLTFLVTEVEKP